MKPALYGLCLVTAVACASSAVAGATCGVSRDKAGTTETTLVVKYNVSGCPAYSEPAGAKARVCLEKEGTNSWVCNTLERSNTPDVGTATGTMRFIGLSAGTNYRAIGYYAKKIGDKIYWSMTNSVLLRTKG